MKIVNEGIRGYAAEKGVRLWQVAEKLGLRDFQFSRLLRHELSKEDAGRVMDAINAVADENGTEG